MMSDKPIKLTMMLLLFVAIIFAWQGVAMHMQVASEEAAFHELQDDYFSQSKVIRDAAETDSTLSKKLVEIRNYPSELLRLKLVGVGKILIGIFLVLIAILIMTAILGAIGQQGTWILIL